MSSSVLWFIVRAVVLEASPIPRVKIRKIMAKYSRPRDRLTCTRPAYKAGDHRRRPRRNTARTAIGNNRSVSRPAPRMNAVDARNSSGSSGADSAGMSS